MTITALDLFTIGIGPSSSHTVGPMKAARRMVAELRERGLLGRVARMCVELGGSLGATGVGHGTDRAVVLGLMGAEPDTVDTATIATRVAAVAAERTLPLGGEHPIGFDPASDLVFDRRMMLPLHPNGMVFRALDAAGAELLRRDLYSVGGGFVVDAEGAPLDATATEAALPHPFGTGAELLAACRSAGVGVAALMRRNDEAVHGAGRLDAGLLRIWEAMAACVDAGCRADAGLLPGGLRVPRRAPALAAALTAGGASDPAEWVALYALAVNEENAAGGRVVTAPTNGAAGIIPAVLAAHLRENPAAGPETAVRFLLAAAAIGVLLKRNASISGAEVGCQGEVGSACAMAAAGLCEVLGGTPEQVENAAEIGLEHHLGLTCDPVGGLVQIPCIERNAVAANTAVTAARLALRGDGTHRVPLDVAIRTMRDTGADMKSKYKETSRGGLAVNVVEC